MFLFHRSLLLAVLGSSPGVATVDDFGVGGFVPPDATANDNNYGEFSPDGFALATSRGSRCHPLPRLIAACGGLLGLVATPAGHSRVQPFCFLRFKSF
jgi:hypothetical protein